jgi:AcrR family transcriptional regulator
MLIHRLTVDAGTAGHRSPINWAQPAGDRYAIREIVALTDVPPSSIHHYRRLGLLPEPQRSSLNRFVYDDRHVTALRLIRSLRQRGCTLQEIREVLPELLHAHRRRSATTNGLDLDELISDRHPDAKLIDAAIDAFAEHSFREVSIADLCERADVAKGTFYRCYESKEALFLAAARAVVERAIDGFAHEAPAADPHQHTAIFARHLRRGLPVLLELAKRVTQESGPTVGEAVTLFADLARRLGRVVNQVGDDVQVRQAGGLLIMLAVVNIFQELMQAELDHGDDA